MEELLHKLMVVFLYVVFIALIPVIMHLATPFILIWPGSERADGTREKRPIKYRYARIWKIMEGVGVGLPTP